MKAIVFSLVLVALTSAQSTNECEKEYGDAIDCFVAAADNAHEKFNVDLNSMENCAKNAIR